MPFPGLLNNNNRLPTVNDFIGGNVTGIVLGAALRLKAMLTAPPAVQGQSPLEITSNRAYLGYAGIPIHTRRQEAYRLAAEVVQHTLENGAKMSDHVILHPIQIDLQFDISNWVASEAEYILDLFFQLHLARLPVDLITEHKILPRMVMSDFNPINNVPEWGKLSCSASFIQVNFKSVETTTYIEENVTPVEDKTGGPDAAKSASDSIDNGKVETIAPGSVAKQLGGFAAEALERFLQ